MKYKFNEFSEQRIDFTNPEIVEAYDKKQGTNIEHERVLVQELGVSKEHTVIEYGAGTGALSMAMAERCEHVYAVDTSQAMLSYLRKSAKKNGCSNISTHHAGFLSYNHTGNKANHIVTKFCLHHLPDFWKSIALLKFNQNLHMGGKLYIQDVIFSFEPSKYEDSLDSWIKEMTQSGKWSKEEFETHVNAEYSTFAWIIEGLIETAGFVIDKSIYTDTYGSLFCRKIREIA